MVGLPFRQLLFAFSPSQTDQDIFFRTLEEELRRSATEFKRSQVELIQLIKEFVEARKSIFAEEEAASRQYIKSLEKAAGLFEESAANYPGIISAALESCTRSLTALQEKSQALSHAAQNLSPDRIEDMVTQFAIVRDASTNLAGALGGLHTVVVQLEQIAANVPQGILQTAVAQFDETRIQIRRRVDEIQTDISAIDRVLTDFVSLTERRIGAAR